MSHGSVYFLVPGANPLSYILKLRNQLRELHNFAYRKSCAVLSMRETGAAHSGGTGHHSSFKSESSAVIFTWDIVHAMVLGLLKYDHSNQLGTVSFHWTNGEAPILLDFFRFFKW